MITTDIKFELFDKWLDEDHYIEDPDFTEFFRDESELYSSEPNLFNYNDFDVFAEVMVNRFNLFNSIDILRKRRLVKDDQLKIAIFRMMTFESTSGIKIALVYHFDGTSYKYSNIICNKDGLTFLNE